MGTAAQRHAWTTFGYASGGWGTLTDDQYRAWDAAAMKEKRRRHWPPSRRLTAQNLFTEINSHQAFLGLPPYLYPPDRPALSMDRLGPLIPSDGRGGFTLKLGVPEVPAGHILVFGARPCNAGRRYCDKFCYLGLLPAPVGGLSNITKLYCEKFGEPWPGSRVIIATQHQLDGWRGILLRIDAVVRGGQGLPAKPRRRRTTAGA